MRRAWRATCVAAASSRRASLSFSTLLHSSSSSCSTSAVDSCTPARSSRSSRSKAPEYSRSVWVLLLPASRHMRRGIQVNPAGTSSLAQLATGRTKRKLLLGVDLVDDGQGCVQLPVHYQPPRRLWQKPQRPCRPHQQIKQGSIPYKTQLQPALACPGCPQAPAVPQLASQACQESAHVNHLT